MKKKQEAQSGRRSRGNKPSRRSSRRRQREENRAFLSGVDRSLTVLPPRFARGQRVEVFSRGLGVWLPGAHACSFMCRACIV